MTRGNAGHTPSCAGRASEICGSIAVARGGGVVTRPPGPASPPRTPAARSSPRGETRTFTTAATSTRKTWPRPGTPSATPQWRREVTSPDLDLGRLPRPLPRPPAV